MFKTYGSSLYDKKSRKILSEAIFNGFNVSVFEQMADGSFKKEKGSTASKFVHKGQLYYYLTHHSGQISRFFELNMDIEKCINGSYGVYYILA